MKFWADASVRTSILRIGLAIIFVAASATSAAAATRTLSITAPSKIVIGAIASFTLDDSAKSSGDFITWDFDTKDGVQIDKAGYRATYVFPTAGTFTIRATVKNVKGIAIYKSKTISIAGRSYQESGAITERDCHYSADSPLIIENLRISHVVGNAIDLENCSHVIIRNNYITGTDSVDRVDDSVGNAIHIQNSSDITIQNNIIVENQSGILIYGKSAFEPLESVLISGNYISGSRWDQSVKVVFGSGIVMSNNIARNNGDFAVIQSHRMSGFNAQNSAHITMFGNLATGSSSDGFSVDGLPDVAYLGKPFISTDAKVYDNVSRKNAEQGVWLNIVHGGSVYNNLLSDNTWPTQDVHGNGIFLESDVSDFNIYDNRIFNNQGSGITVEASSNNNIHNNLIYSDRQSNFQGITIGNWVGTWLHPGATRNNVVMANTVTNYLWCLDAADGTGTQFIKNNLNHCGVGIRIGKKAVDTVLSGNTFTKTLSLDIYREGS